MDILAMKAMVGEPIIGAPDPAPALYPDQVAAAARILGEARNQMIFVGGGAYDAAQEIRELSAMLQAPVVSYQNGRGIVDERSPMP